MPHEMDVSPCPTCLILLVDQSGSMEDAVGYESVAKGMKMKDVIASAVNRTILNLGPRYTVDDADWFIQDLPASRWSAWHRLSAGLDAGRIIVPSIEVGVIGYGRDVGAAFSGSLEGKELVAIRDLMENPLSPPRKRRERPNPRKSLPARRPIKPRPSEPND